MAPEHKEKLIIGGALGVLALLVLWYLSKASAASNVAGSPSPEAVPAGGGASSYPNAQPINFGGIEIGATPLNITYNQQPPKDLIQSAPLENGHIEGGCSCSEADPCGGVASGILVTKNKVPQSVLNFGSSNLSSFQSKAVNTSWLLKAG